MLKANYHTHLVLCGHAQGMSMDYVNEAISIGMVELGISDHAFVPMRFMTKEEFYYNLLNEAMTEEEFLNVYIPDVMHAKGNGKINVLLGLETEYIPEEHEHYAYLRSKVDYLNLGLHFIKIKGKIKSAYDLFYEEDVLKYTEVAIKAMESGLYTTFVHPDLFMMKYQSKLGPFVFDDLCKECSLRIIKAAIDNNVYLEINANGIRHGSRMINGVMEYDYPRSEFWSLVSKTNAKVIIGCDAHIPFALHNENVQKAIDFAKKLKINVLDYMIMKKA